MSAATTHHSGTAPYYFVPSPSRHPVLVATAPSPSESLYMATRTLSLATIYPPDPLERFASPLERIGAAMTTRGGGGGVAPSSGAGLRNATCRQLTRVRGPAGGIVLHAIEETREATTAPAKGIPKGPSCCRRAP
mgnify:CR=1 FL=1